MATSGSARWRGSFALAALVILIGGPMHPGGTAAYVDAANLVAGRATPVLSTHLWLSILRILFPMVGLFALWTLTAAVRPLRVRATAAAHAG